LQNTHLMGEPEGARSPASGACGLTPPHGPPRSCHRTWPRRRALSASRRSGRSTRSTTSLLGWAAGGGCRAATRGTPENAPAWLEVAAVGYLFVRLRAEPAGRAAARALIARYHAASKSRPNSSPTFDERSATSTSACIGSRSERSLSMQSSSPRRTRCAALAARSAGSAGRSNPGTRPVHRPRPPVRQHRSAPRHHRRARTTLSGWQFVHRLSAEQVEQLREAVDVGHAAVVGVHLDRFEAPGRHLTNEDGAEAGGARRDDVRAR